MSQQAIIKRLQNRKILVLYIMSDVPTVTDAVSNMLPGTVTLLQHSVPYIDNGRLVADYFIFECQSGAEVELCHYIDPSIYFDEDEHLFDYTDELCLVKLKFTSEPVPMVIL